MIRKLILRVLITTVAIFIILYFIPGIVFTGSYIEFAQIVAVLLLTNLLVKPILKVFALPIEVATMGLISIIVDMIVLFGLSLWLSGLKITSFWFSGLSGGTFLIAPIEIPVIGTLFISALLLGFVSAVLYWLTKK